MTPIGSSVPRETKVSKLLPGDCFQNCCRLGALQSETSIISRHVLNTDIKIRFALQQRQISLGTARGIEELVLS
jgi:hypothetical protein